MSRGWHLPAALLLGLVVRVPFWAEALRTPVDGDTAILGLMALHPGRGTTMWGQPYGSPVEAWLLAPILAAFGGTPDALRFGYFLLGLALIPAGYALARAVDPRIALPVAVLLACPPPYFLLLSALPPPLYPTALVLSAGLLTLALHLGERLRKDPPPIGLLLAWGAVAGLALWTHLMTLTVIATTAVYIVTRGRLKAGLFAVPLLALVVASAPWWQQAVGGAPAAVLSGSSRRATIAQHFRATARRIHIPLGGVLGTHVPLLADDPDTVVLPPRTVAAGLIVLYGVGVILAARRSRSSPPVRLLLATAVLVLAVFPFPARSGPATIRFLTPLYLPVAVAILWGVMVRWGTRRTWVLVLALCAGHLLGGQRLVAAWRHADRAAAPFLLPDLRPALQVLQAHGVRRVYASYGPSYRLTFESRERVIATQPWNERFLHHALPFLDEVRFSKNVAWVLTPSVPTDLPPPHVFEQHLAAAGGHHRRTPAGAAVVYDTFVPPFDPAVARAPSAGLAGDGDPYTAFHPDPRQPFTVTLGDVQPLEAITLLAGNDGPRLLRSMDVEVSADGATFHPVTQRRRRGERGDLRWVNGHPQYVIDHDILAIPLGRRRVRAIRITPVLSDEPWTLAEVLLHRPETARRGPWDEWLDPGLGWAERRQALLATPHPEREDWYYRLGLAGRH